MVQKLTYEQWCEKFTISITDKVRHSLKEYHNIDADAEVDQARRKEYEFYINGGFDNDE
jgi:hypothetical protein